MEKLGRLAKGMMQSKIVLALVWIAFAFTIYTGLIKVNADFPVGAFVTISPGMTLTEIADRLEGRKIIDSPFLFKNFVILLNGEHEVIAGEYFFSEPLSVFRVALRVTRGFLGVPLNKVTIPEGFNAREIASRIKENIDGFDDKAFFERAAGKEGYLFPDTYFFPSNLKPEQAIATLEDNFYRQIRPLEKEIASFGRPLGEVVIMASLIEEEAKTPESRRIISGILWKRLELGMPLQVDAAFVYVNGKTTYELTAKDLQIDSPYNTYRYKGLPKGPIANPGFDALEAAVTPTASGYLYYLSDRQGNMYYAKDFEAHKKNRERYLDN